MRKLVQVNSHTRKKEDVILPTTNNPISLFHWQDEFYRGAPSHIDYIVVDEDDNIVLETEKEFEERPTPKGIRFLRTKKDFEGIK